MRCLDYFILILALPILANPFPSPAAESAETLEQPLYSFARESSDQGDLRMKWWREARFGMFIHWGLSAVPAGSYEGNRISCDPGWIMSCAQIPVAEYAQYARRFNPTRYSAEKWVQAAKQAGMRYIVFTSKHHEGFAMFRSDSSLFNIYNSTPFGRDPLKDLAEACRKEGIKLGLYYSQAQDWHHPGGATWGGIWDETQYGDMDTYLDKVAIPQVREILSNYGEVSVLWWDTAIDMTPERVQRFLPLLQIQPNIITNNRLGGDSRFDIYTVPGDFQTPEQYIPSTGIEGLDWETCMTMNDSWNYSSYDRNWKSPSTLIRNLIDAASKGGNYLLSVGPNAKGEIPQASMQRLNAIGRWMKVNGESIYGTSASPFAELPFNGRCTRKAGKLYFHIFDWPKNKRLSLPPIIGIKKAYLLMNPSKSLTIKSVENGEVVTLPRISPNPYATVLVVEVAE